MASPTRRRPLALCTAVSIVSLSLAISFVSANTDHVQAEIDRLKEAVRHAETDAQNSHSKKDVVDLGASLRIVEDRFAGLKSALLSEMGGFGDSGKASEGSAALKQHAEELSSRGAEMVQKLSKSRSEVHAVLAEVRTMDSATAELKGAITKLETEIADLGKALQQAHVDSHVLASAHSELRETVRDVHSRSSNSVQSSRHSSFIPKWYYVVFIEFVTLLLFASYKVYNMRRKDKFSKLG